MLEHPAMLRGTVERLRFRGASLVGNALGDPSERELIVYLPPSYAEGARAGARFPVVMVLAGFAATHESLLSFKPWEPNLLARYERLIGEGCGEAILVLPDCFTRLGGSQYLDSPAVGRYQTYLCEDVLGLVDARFRTIARPEGRAIVGKSSGGFGALRMGMDRPGHFSVFGSHAGDCAFELSVQPRFVEVAPVYERAGGADAFLASVLERGGPRGQSEFHALEMLALAHVYAPREGGGGELPFDPYTAMIDPDRWARWLAHDPLRRPVSPPPDAGNPGQPLHSLLNARLVFLDAGKSDEYGLQFGARLLARRLGSLDVAVDHEEFEGGHMGTAYRYDVSLPKIIAALERAPSTTASSSTPPMLAREARGTEPLPDAQSAEPPQGATGARASRRPL